MVGQDKPRHHLCSGPCLYYRTLVFLFIILYGMLCQGMMYNTLRVLQERHGHKYRFREWHRVVRWAQSAIVAPWLLVLKVPTISHSMVAQKIMTICHQFLRLSPTSFAVVIRDDAYGFLVCCKERLYTSDIWSHIEFIIIYFW